MRELPDIPRDLLEALEARFPERVPNGNETERELWLNTGKVHLVRFLRATYEIQTTENILGEVDVQA